MISAKINVNGKVQGVWFRDYVKRSAKELDLTGRVKNNSDGSVSVEVEGKKEIVKQLIDKIRIGSPLSRVDNVTVDWQKFENKYNFFEIIR